MKSILSARDIDLVNNTRGIVISKSSRAPPTTPRNITHAEGSATIQTSSPAVITVVRPRVSSHLNSLSTCTKIMH